MSLRAKITAFFDSTKDLLPHVPLLPQDKMATWLDAAKDLAIQIGANFDTGPVYDLPKNARMVPVMHNVMGQVTFEVDVKERMYLFGARCFNEPKKILITSIKGSLIKADESDEQEQSELTGNPGFDVAFWNTDDHFCPFDFGLVDPEHPLEITAVSVDDVKLNLVLFGVPLAEGAKVEDVRDIIIGVLDPTIAVQ